MNNYKRTLVIPIASSQEVLHDLATKFNNKVNINRKRVGDRHYVVAEFVSEKPYAYPLVATVKISRNSDRDHAIDALRRNIVISDMDFGNTITVDWGTFTFTDKGFASVDSGDVNVTVTDPDGASTTVQMEVAVVDEDAAVITAEDTVLAYADIAAWNNNSLVITDNDDDTFTISNAAANGTFAVVYKDDAGDTLGTNTIAGFRTYLQNSGVGGKIGAVVYTFTDNAGNVSTPVTCVVKSKFKPVIKNSPTLNLTHEDFETWTDIVPVATGDAIPPALASSVDASALVVKTYFEANGTTPIADIAGFIAYMTSDGETIGKIKLNLEGADEVVVTVTKAAAV